MLLINLQKNTNVVLITIIIHVNTNPKLPNKEIYRIRIYRIRNNYFTNATSLKITVAYQRSYASVPLVLA